MNSAVRKNLQDKNKPPHLKIIKQRVRITCQGGQKRNSSSLQAEHGPNNYKDTKPQLSAFLKKFTFKGTWRQVFICLRPPGGGKAIL
jgi:hypothetical protein